MIRRIKHSYYVVMIDYGRPYPGKKGPSGFEAVVNPEDTRSSVIRRIASGEYKHIVFIHLIDDEVCDNVTDELVDAAEQLVRYVREVA